MSGEGAWRYGGRWNSVGRAAVFLGESLALAGMELLLHLRAERVLETYRKMSVFIPERLVMHVGEDQLPPDWALPSLYPVTQEIGDGWIDHARSAVLQAPSAVIRGETNFIVNPSTPTSAPSERDPSPVSATIRDWRDSSSLRGPIPRPTTHALRASSSSGMPGSTRCAGGSRLFHGDRPAEPVPGLLTPAPVAVGLDLRHVRMPAGWR